MNPNFSEYDKQFHPTASLAKEESKMENSTIQAVTKFVREFVDNEIGLDAASFSVFGNLIIVARKKDTTGKEPNPQNWDEKNKRYMREEWTETGDSLVAGLKRGFELDYEIYKVNHTFVELRSWK